MSKPKKNPFLPEDKQPVMECRFCNHYEIREKDGFKDLATGCCLHTGLSTVPPRHVCSDWEKKNPKGRKGNR